MFGVAGLGSHDFDKAGAERAGLIGEETKADRAVSTRAAGALRTFSMPGAGEDLGRMN
jgi:hypothetical protein